MVESDTRSDVLIEEICESATDDDLASYHSEIKEKLAESCQLICINSQIQKKSKQSEIEWEETKACQIIVLDEKMNSCKWKLFEVTLIVDGIGQKHDYVISEFKLAEQVSWRRYVLEFGVKIQDISKNLFRLLIKCKLKI